MNPIKEVIGKINHKKSEKAWIKVHNQIKYQDKVIISLSTTKGYDEFFATLSDEGLEWRLDDSMRDIVYVYVEKKKKPELIVGGTD